MKAPINDFLRTHANRDLYPFHMPGHKRNKDFLTLDVDFDITEIDGADNLLAPTGIILEAEQNIARVYGACETFILVNGSSAGVVASILATCFESEILLSRNCHLSAYNGAILANATVHFVYPEATKFSFFGAVGSEKIDQIITLNKKISAVVVTSPTFEGVCSDIFSIAKVVHKHGKILIVDEAHGAHFGFHEKFPKSAITLGADIVIQSLHKTLPAPNQCALLHICSDRVSPEFIRKCLSTVQTTSPSYVFMAAIERCVSLVSERHLFDQYVDMLEKFRRFVPSDVAVTLVNRSDFSLEACFDLDVGKLSFSINCCALNGEKISKIFRDDHTLELEMASIHHFIAMTSPCDTSVGFNRLARALEAVNKNFQSDRAHGDFVGFSRPSQAGLSLRKAFFSQQVLKPYKHQENEYAAAFITPYPPGIPLLVPGEKITGETIDLIDKYVSNGVNILGVKDDNIKIIG